MTFTREQARRLERAISLSGISPGEPHPCPYLPGRQSRNLTLVPSPLAPGVYEMLMQLNFRRMGPFFYRPECGTCRECRAVRVFVEGFRPNRSQRRCRARNLDLVVSAGPPRPTPAKHALYRRYLEARHDGLMSGSEGEFEAFLYRSPLSTIEMEYRAQGRLIGVGIADLEPRSMSAVYCYFEPDAAARAPGVFNVLWMLDECRRRSLSHLYLGYFVRGSAKMSYKGGFKPRELLGTDGEWRPL